MQKVEFTGWVGKSVDLKELEHRLHLICPTKGIAADWKMKDWPPRRVSIVITDIPRKTHEDLL